MQHRISQLQRRLRRIGSVFTALLLAAASFLLADFPGVRPAFAESALPVARAARLAGDDQRTRFVMDIDRMVAFRIFALPDPYRVVIDLPELEFGDSSNVETDGRGLVSAYRYGRFAPGKSRIVLDTNGPFRIDKSFLLEPVESQPARLVVDIVPADRRAFMRELALAPPPPAEEAGESPVPEKPQASSVPLQPVPPGGAPGAMPLIVVDAGHGGVDPGAKGQGGTLEKDIVLAVARMFAGKLEESGRYRVKLTRDDDRFIKLGDRVDIARNAEASLLISIHADAIKYTGISGATVYTRSEKASDLASQLLADRENRADLIAGVDLSEESDEVAGILFDLVRRETRNFSTVFGRGLIDEFRGHVRLIKNPLRSARFHVLAAPDVPSVLIELGYLTNAKDEQVMKTEAWREKVTNAMVSAVDAYFGRGFAQKVN
ncbi:MAG: N-acetylmuramoyl-L-alanine amidase [Tepidamorphaceae bacterium]|nr:N-acetylmuramoyl-L-alanine amidase [Rhodobiaceae bacterium]MCC0050114.1 N-acetylmuramoyl-L-alanine amidase [Rhodobiaceae bacterium]